MLIKNGTWPRIQFLVPIKLSATLLRPTDCSHSATWSMLQSSGLLPLLAPAFAALASGGVGGGTEGGGCACCIIDAGGGGGGGGGGDVPSLSFGSRSICDIALSCLSSLNSEVVCL